MQQKDTMLPAGYDLAVERLDDWMRLKYSFDVIGRKMSVGGRRATMYFVDGFIKDEIMEFTMKLTADDLKELSETQTFADRFIPYVEVDLSDRLDKIATAILSGTIALLVEGYPQVILIDARTYPARSVGEPDDDRVLRGSRDGFVETLVFNTALIRRRIRDPRLTMEILQIGKVSKTDVVVCYLDGRADPKIVEQVKRELEKIDINSLNMGQESLSECLLRRQWYNPFPKIRYTERPDCAAAGVAEGRVLVIIDNTPAVMILPTSLFDFVQDTNDYYFPPLVGTYLRTVRSVVFFLTLFLTPVWYLLMRNPDWIPAWLDFVRIKEMNSESWKRSTSTP